MTIYDLYYIPDYEIEAILLECKDSDIQKIFGIKAKELVKWMDVKRWLYELNLKEKISEIKQQFNESEINEAKEAVALAIKEFSDNHEINVYEDLIYLNELEVEKLVSSCSEEDLFKSLITAPDVIREQVTSSFTKSLAVRFSRNSIEKEIHSITEINLSQARLLEIMKKFRDNNPALKVPHV